MCDSGCFLVAGAIVGLAALGPRTVRLLLLPHLAKYLAHLQPLLSAQVWPKSIYDLGLFCCRDWCFALFDRHSMMFPSREEGSGHAITCSF